MSRIFALILFFFLPFLSLAQTQSYEASLPFYDGERLLGDVKVEMKGETLQLIDKITLMSALGPHLEGGVKEKLERLPPRINPVSFPFPLKFDPREFKLETSLPMSARASEKLKLHDDPREKYQGEAIRPAPIGGAINYRTEQNWASSNRDAKYFSGQFDSFINMKTFVLESQTFYQSNQERKWFRGDTRIVKDLEDKQIRVQAGDVYPLVQGFMVPRPVGGINIARNFSLNPYRLPYPTGTQNFTLLARSLVKYFVNGVLIKSEYLPAGNYTAKDIPLNNGLNTVTVEATDDLGQKKVFIFRSAASINLLNQGESRFDLSYGTPFFDTNFQRTYTEKDGKLFSGFYQYGFSSAFSSSLYGQNQKEHTLLGAELIQATTIGNFILGHAESRLNGLKGGGHNLSYQVIGQRMTMSLRYEYRTPEFRTSLSDTSSVVQNNYGANVTLPVANVLTFSLGGNYGDVRDNSLSDRLGFDSTLNVRIFNHHTLSFYVGRNRDERKNWNDVAYAFLTITFPESNDFISTFYDQKQKDTKITYIKDNQNRLFKPKAQAIAQNNSELQSGEVDVTYPTPFADFGGRVHSDHLIASDSLVGRGSVRMNSALVFAYQDRQLGVGISRPVTGSFVLFKPERSLRKQKIALKSTSPFTEAQTGLLGEITFSNLLAYQYREIQLDPTFLDIGTSLTREKFVLYPTYKSAHLITLLEKGSIMITGQLQNKEGRPWSLEVGHLGDKTFFTNREGEFFIEGIDPGIYELKLNGQTSKIPISISEKERGMKRLGRITLEEEE